MPDRVPIRVDLLLPAPGPDELQGWGRIRRVLRVYPADPLEVLGGIVSFIRAAACLANGTWWLAGFLFGAGLWQIWACAEERDRPRLLAALFQLVLIGVVARWDYILWQGYASSLVHQVWIALRCNPLVSPKPKESDARPA